MKIEKSIIYGSSDYDTVRGKCLLFGIIVWLVVMLYTGQISEIIDDTKTYYKFKDTWDSVRELYLPDYITHGEVNEYPTLLEYLFRNFDLLETLMTIGYGVAAYLITFSWLKHMCVTVTNLRVYGKIGFGKQIDFPITHITSATTSFLDGVSIMTTSGTYTFRMIDNAFEVQSKISEIIRNPKILEEEVAEAAEKEETNPNPPVTVFPTDYGQIICPVCNTKQRDSNNSCYKCWQKFILVKSDNIPSVETINDIGKKNIPIRVYPDEIGRIKCPACGTKQNGYRYNCLRCGQVFINSQPDIKYWCANCGKEGAFENDFCPDCGSTMKIYNTVFNNEGE